MMAMMMMMSEVTPQRVRAGHGLLNGLLAASCTASTTSL
jgi:hypothetical protein